MVTLLCFCCDHLNPGGARFCNACGTPLHLRPCRHCEAINARAAAHCHQCGETFALEFLAVDQAARLEDATGGPPASARAQARAHAAEPRIPRHRVVVTRIGAVALGLMATALVSAYYAYRQPGGGVADAARIEGLLPTAGVTPVAETAPASALSLDPAGMDRSPPASLPAPRDGVAETAASGASPTPSAASARAPRSGTPATTQRRGAPATRSAATAKRHPSTSVGRSGSSSPSRAGAPAAPAGEAAGALVQDRPVDPVLVHRRPVALQQAVAPPSGGSGAAPVGPAQRPPASRPPEAAPRPAPAMPAWERPCAEGVALEPGCDVRTMAKGN